MLLEPTRIYCKSLAAAFTRAGWEIDADLFALLDTAPSGELTPRVLGAMLALGALGTGIAYVWNFQVIERAGATMASTVTYLTPLVAIAVGVSLLGEALTLNEPLGGLVVLLGVALAQGRLALPAWRAPA